MNARRGPSFQRIFSDAVRALEVGLRSGETNRKAIHQVRIRIKNLRALMAAVHAIAETTPDGKKLLAMMDTIFIRAGKLRTAQVEAKLLKQTGAGSDLSYGVHLQRRIKSQRKKLAQELLAFNADKFDAHSAKVKTHIGQLKNADFQAALTRTRESEMKKLRSLWAMGRNDKRLHEIRKRLRIIRRTMEIELQIERAGRLKSWLEQVVKVESLIGDWHDKDLLAQSLEKYCGESIRADGRQLIGIAKRMRARNAAAVVQIADGLESLVFSRKSVVLE